MNDTEFKLRINCTFDAGQAHQFQETLWPELRRVLESHGAKEITSASLEGNGKTISLPTEGFAVAR